MEEYHIIQQLKSIWEETFGDSKEYINLVFENLYNSSVSDYVEIDGKIIASVIGIPYTLTLTRNTLTAANIDTLALSKRANHCQKNEAKTNYEGYYDAENEEDFSEKIEIPGVYICGVATLPEHRGKGIMSDLLTKLHEKIRKQGYAFTFLIPAGDGLRRYYQQFGYSDLSYKTKIMLEKSSAYLLENNTSLSNKHSNNGTSTNGIIEHIRPKKLMENPDLVREIANYITVKEHKFHHGAIIHPLNNLQTAITELGLSETDIFLYRSTVGQESDSDSAKFPIQGIATCNLSETENNGYKKSTVRYIIGDSLEIEQELIAEIQKSINGKLKSVDRNLKSIDGNFKSIDGDLKSIDGNLLEIEVLRNSHLFEIVNTDSAFSKDSNCKSKVIESDHISKSDSTKLRQELKIREIIKEKYAQVKILDFSKILKFATNDKDDFKYSILTNQENFCKIDLQKEIFDTIGSLQSSGHDFPQHIDVSLMMD